jgi:hypothetical protein
MRQATSRQADGVDETERFSACSDGAPATRDIPLCDVIQAIWEQGRARQRAAALLRTKHAPGRSTVRQDR